MVKLNFLEKTFAQEYTCRLFVLWGTCHISSVHLPALFLGTDGPSFMCCYAFTFGTGINFVFSLYGTQLCSQLLNIHT